MRMNGGFEQVVTIRVAGVNIDEKSKRGGRLSRMRNARGRRAHVRMREPGTAQRTASLVVSLAEKFPPD